MRRPPVSDEFEEGATYYVDDYDEDQVPLNTEEVLLLEAVAQPEPEGRVYTVRSGEGLQRIAHRTSTKAKAIAALNPDVDFGNLKPGTQLRLP